MPHGGQHPTEEAINITRKFLGGELGSPGVRPESQQVGGKQLPGQASDVARGRAFGQQGARQRRGGGDLISPLGPFIPPTGVAPLGSREGSLSDTLFDLPGPVGFSRTPQGRAILQRILQRFGRRA